MNIAILGAGWLGSALAHSLQNNNHNVKVSVTSTEKKQLLHATGINAFVVSATNDTINGELNFFKNIDVLVCTLTPQPINIFKTLANEIEKQGIKKVIICSSTGIYQNCTGLVTENSHLNTDIEKVNLLKNIEDTFLNQPTFTATILRLGGLIGGNRHPVIHLAKKTEISDGNEPVNIVFLETILKNIQLLINKPLLNTVFNLVENDHRTKEAFYTAEAKKHTLTLPPFTKNSAPKNRIVSTNKIQKHLTNN
ncbi:NAD(P)H-binding protein [Myroides sp. JBRI-B21084]|uniref:NAD(P)H-binding protein n=1 Tax=Myroides sp. JBRI-B21084 TaxID=3119977 RepID=UPI0026E2C3F6|nr:NAD(P)H-binding protein [Paenimyroides cloacae]WKW46109.1 NAD(P)H-binding protein [Paenimyroides cloacae]